MDKILWQLDSLSLNLKKYQMAFWSWFTLISFHNDDIDKIKLNEGIDRI